MTRTSTTQFRIASRLPLAAGIIAILAASPLTLSGCDKDENVNKTTTTKTTQTPDGTKKTTETTEKKTEVEHKNTNP